MFMPILQSMNQMHFRQSVELVDHSILSEINRREYSDRYRPTEDIK